MKIRFYTLVTTMGLLAACAGTRPLTLGVTNGKLADCPSSPNCISSFSSTKQHQVAPIGYSDTQEQAHARIIGALSDLERVKVIQSDSDYIYAEFKSALLGFVDDVEFYLTPKPQLIHIRSASRLGRSDFGANRKRYEKLKLLLQQK